MLSVTEAAMESVSRFTDDPKRRDLKNVTISPNSESGLTTDHGVKVPDTDNWYIYPNIISYNILNYRCIGSKFPMDNTLDLHCLKIRSAERKSTDLIMNVSLNVSFMLVVSELMATFESLMVVLQNTQLRLS
jgi:hypothetical protein